jgi:hypothetical protein
MNVIVWTNKINRLANINSQDFIANELKIKKQFKKECDFYFKTKKIKFERKNSKIDEIL